MHIRPTSIESREKHPLILGRTKLGARQAIIYSPRNLHLKLGALLTISLAEIWMLIETWCAFHMKNAIL